MLILCGKIERGVYMGQFFKLYGLSAIIFLVFDIIWLIVGSKKVYQPMIGHLMGEVKFGPAIIFYLVYLVGVVFFILQPGIEKQSLMYVLKAAALFGFICYATYDLTNLASLKDWPWQVTVIDLIWGTFATTTTSVLAYWLYTIIWGSGKV